ncbi:hypothetical protein T484DRAFT_1861323, partial [Baffinella frigidus]
VYRGVKNRAITDKDLKAGHFVEMGAQSFTLDKNVAKSYSGDSDAKASYLFEVQEGEVDRGADISPLSYYPEEREKLYGALAMMQVVGDRVEGGTVVLKMRLNVNAKAGTIDEVVNRKHTWLKASAEMLLREAKSAPAVLRLEGKEQGSSRLGELQALLQELQEETEPWGFNDSEVFMQRSRTLTDTWKGVLRHAELVEAVEGLLGMGEVKEGAAGEAEGVAGIEEAAAIQEAERMLLGLRSRARLGKLEGRLRIMRAFEMMGLVRMWKVVVWGALLVYVLGVMWVPWIVLWGLDTVLSQASVGFFSAPLADLQAHWLTAFIVLLFLPFGSPDDWLTPDFLPWTSVTLGLRGLEVSALSSAVEQLQQAVADGSSADDVGKGGLQDELRRAEEAVRKLWASGGLRVKERMGGNVRSTVMEALAGQSTSKLAEEHRGERFREAVAHLVESCGELPMDDRATRLQFRGVRDDTLKKLSGKSSLTLEQKLGWMGEGDGLKRRSVSRLLELFKAGTDAHTVTFRSSEVEDDWEAEHAGFFLVSCEYLDGFPLDQVCTGKLTELEALALSRKQAAMLARFVTIHAPGDVTLTIGEHRFGVRFGKGAAAELFGLKKKWDNSGTLNLQKEYVTVDVLRAVVASAKCSTRSRGEGSPPIPPVKTLLLNTISALGEGDGGEEAAELIMELARLAFPELEALDVKNCRLGDRAAAKLAEGIAHLPKLRLLNAGFNRVGLRGKSALLRAWRRARKPNLFWYTPPESCAEEGAILDMMDYLCWGSTLPGCAMLLTGGYCGGLLNPDKCKTWRVANSEAALSSEELTSEAAAARRRALGDSVADSSEGAGGSVGEARDVPEALRMEEARGGGGAGASPPSAALAS